jgi:three-Cys-motif partner protein
MASRVRYVDDPIDGLRALSVGFWSADKTDRIRRYVHACWAARARFSQRTYIDLFCGPGRVYERFGKEWQDGSAVSAFSQSSREGGAFTKFIIGDIDPINLKACADRISNRGGQPIVLQGPAQETVVQAVKHVNHSGLNLAVLDPFSLNLLDFSVISTLAKLNHVDIIAHFSLMDLRRNLITQYRDGGGPFDLVAPNWRNHVSAERLNKREAPQAFENYWINLIQQTGLTAAVNRPVFKNAKRAELYRLILFSRNDLAHKIWNSAASDPAQRGFEF